MDLRAILENGMDLYKRSQGSPELTLEEKI
jgi:hypothetical protein